MALTIIIFIFILGLLIFVHEFGHFITAKKAGLKIEEFGFGLPPRLFGIKRGETIYSINLLPLGGFVKIYGEDGLKEEAPAGKNKRDRRAFYNQPIVTRAIIIAAGVTMNLFLAAFLLGLGYFIGLPEIISDQEVAGANRAQVQIIQVAPGSPAEAVGLKLGDTIRQIRVDNRIEDITTLAQAQSLVETYSSGPMVFVIERGNQILEKTFLAPSVPSGEKEPLGIILARTALVSYPWYQSIIKGVVGTAELTGLIVVTLGELLWRLVTNGQLAFEVTGPVGIFNLTNQAAQLGFIYVLQLMIFLSINLAIINILPFPALDGGRLLFLVVERIKGSPVSQRIEGLVHAAGFALLMLLMVAITWRDIVRFF